MEASDTILSQERRGYYKKKALKESSKQGCPDIALEELEEQAWFSFQSGQEEGMRKIVKVVEKLHLIRPERDDIWQSELKKLGLV